MKNWNDTRRWRNAAALVVGLVLSLGLTSIGWGQDLDSNLFRGLQWRPIGPYRGGRVTAVSGVAGQPLVYYMGATGGGVWKTEDGGLNWHPISDGYFKRGSVGAIAVSASDPRVIYAGMGEACLRNDISHGDGVYKSIDGGRSWVHVGLDETRHIGRIRVHPNHPEWVYVAALGHVFGENEERGVFRSRDGGATWEKVLFVDRRTGAVDLAMDPNHSHILYAAMWQVRHRPWGIFSGGAGSGLYKSSNGGDSWVELSEGLPSGPKGRIGVTVSPVNSNRVWALVEAERGGVYRSDDGGLSWQLLNHGIQVRRRPEYYSHIFADTRDEETVYVLTSPFLKSTDGGRTFGRIRVPHGDTHDLWIAPEDSQRMINGNDGGACISFNGGKSWSRLDNQPTAQFYTLTTDDQFPYRIYGSQQDNTTVSIPSRTTAVGIDRSDWYPVGGGESGYIAPDPKDPNVIYAGSYWGLMTRLDRGSGSLQNIQPWPEIPGGLPAAEWKYRFDWTFPILLSRHDGTLYAAANVVFRSRNGGRSWEVISPDLTRDEKEKEGQRLTEIYGALASLAESPLQQEVIWTGSNDGRVHLTRDGGRSWEGVTPAQLLPWARINRIEASPHAAGTAYLAVERHKLDDYAPYIFKTTDYGKSWTLLVEGIPATDFLRSVREDPKRPGLLFAGTETGVYVSWNGGQNWHSLQLNLPAVPIADLAVKESDLVATTHGRAFWILDDLSWLEQRPREPKSSPVHLFQPRESYRMKPSRRRPSGPLGKNPTGGVSVHYYLGEKPPGTLRLDFLDQRGQLIRSFSPASSDPSKGLPAEAGMNHFVWDMRYPDAHGLTGGTHLFGGSLRGPLAVPGRYQVELKVGDHSLVQTFQIRKDPRIATSREAFQEQFDLLIQIRDRLTAAHDAANRILELKAQLQGVRERAQGLKGAARLRARIDDLSRQLSDVLGRIVELRFSGVDDQMLLYPVQLNVKIGYLQSVVASADQGPTAQSYKVFQSLSAQLDTELRKLNDVVEKGIPEFNQTAQKEGLPLILKP